MAADYVDHIRSVQPDGPYHLLGWSFGGNVAHAIATQLQRHGAEVAMLAILDAYPPSRPEPGERGSGEEESSELEIVARYLRALGFEFDPADLAEGGREMFGRYVEFLRREGMPAAILEERDILALKDIYINNVRIMRKFVPDHYIGDAVFFAALPDSTDQNSRRDLNIWRPYIEGRVDKHDIACKHNDMTQPEPLAGIGRVLAEKLDALAEKGTTREGDER